MSTKVTALQGALAAEHAAVYGYGVVGAMLAGQELADARADWNAHQVARDALEAVLIKLGATPVVASPAYALPFAVTSAEDGNIGVTFALDAAGLAVVRSLVERISTKRAA